MTVHRDPWPARQRNARYRHRGRSLLGAMGGLLTAAMGCCLVLYIYAFCSMVSPGIVGWDCCKAVLEGMFLTLNAIPLVIGTMMLLAGASVTLMSIWKSTSVDKTSKHHSLFGISGMVLLGAVILFLVIACLM